MAEILATQNWSDEQFQLGESARKTYIVTGAVDLAEACAAVPYQKGSTHPRDSRLFAQEPIGDNGGGPLVFKVTVAFSRVQPKGNGSSTDPLDEPALVRWIFGKESLPFNRDIDGNAVINSSRQPHDPATKPFPTIGVYFERWEASVDPTLILDYVGKINSDAFSIICGGVRKSVLPGQAYVDSIMPVSDYDETAQKVRMGYTILLRRYLPGTAAVSDYQYRSSFNRAILDMGSIGWFTVSGVTKPGKIADDNGPVSADVPLNGKGKPLDATYKILDANGNKHDPVEHPKGAPKGSVQVEAKETDGTVAGVYNVWRDCEVIAFLGMGL